MQPIHHTLRLYIHHRNNRGLLHFEQTPHEHLTVIRFVAGKVHDSLEHSFKGDDRRIGIKPLYLYIYSILFFPCLVVFESRNELNKNYIKHCNNYSPSNHYNLRSNKRYNRSKPLLFYIVLS